MDGPAGEQEPGPRQLLGPEPWTPKGSPPLVEPARKRRRDDDVRWHTAWRLMAFSLAISACAFFVAWLEHRTAQGFARSAQVTTGRVVESDCWTLCKGGPDIQVAYTSAQTGRRVGALLGYERHYAVGDTVTVVYSDDPDAADSLGLPPADTVAPRIDQVARDFAIAGTVALVPAFLAWAFPANLRRLDRRDAARASAASAAAAGR